MCNIIFKSHLVIMFMMVLSLPFIVQSQDKDEQNMPEMPQSGHPSKAVIIIVLSIMFTSAFLLLAYVKFCRISSAQILNLNSNLQTTLTRSRSILSSGVDKQVIESLPFFKFSSLKGSKQGLECTVCLSKFEDIEVLRLLPKCKHAFHLSCIDKWLESHSTCPLCRYKVEAGDIKNFSYSLSSRSLRVPSNLTEDPNLEIFIQRESSRRKNNNQELLIDQDGGGSSGGGSTTKFKPLHLINHRILISDVVTRSRWSDLNSSDLLSLNCEMLNDMCSTRFSPSESNNSEKFQGVSIHFPSASNEEEDENSFTALNPAEKRSMSEIANVPRFAEMGKQSRFREYNGENGSEERLWRIWMPIARRTVQLFARQERNLVELEDRPLASNV